MSAPRRFAAGILLIAILCASSETARITFILVNDIYLMADQMMPDGERRGGFARLAAVIKAERARGRQRDRCPCRRYAVSVADVGPRPW
jgi:2',3'-cyclic-nucleotide 2'-phosphodiesterase (5'-nucleotidase family)